MISLSLLAQLLDRATQAFPAAKPLYGLLAAGIVVAIINVICGGLNRLTFISIFAVLVASVILSILSKMRDLSSKFVTGLASTLAVVVVLAFLFVVGMSAWLSVTCTPKLFAHIYGVTDVCYPPQQAVATPPALAERQPPGSETKNTAATGPVIWDLDAQFLLVSNGGPLTQVHAIFFEGKSLRSIKIRRAFAISGMTGHRQDFMALVPYKGDYAVDQVDIPPDTRFAIETPFKPPFSARDFLAEWGKCHITIVYDDGNTYEHDFSEDYVAEKLRRMSPDAFAPHITPRQ